MAPRFVCVIAAAVEGFTANRAFSWLLLIVDLAVDEIRLSGGGRIQGLRRLRSMLDDLATLAPADRQPVLRDQLSELDRAAAAFDSERDERRARGDRQ